MLTKTQEGYLTDEEKQDISHFRESYDKIRHDLSKKIVGLDVVIEQLLICLFSGGHSLLIGVPGLAKTLLIRSLAELLSLSFSRIQFTPDLMPSDITGTEVLVQHADSMNREFIFLKGPLFANIILADEINRTPPKTQASLLEAMGEKSVTSIGKRYQIERPFFVMATQNPIEQEGTYPLPISQLDRFMFNILIDYPSLEEEKRIIRLTVSNINQGLQPILTKEDILNLLGIVRKVKISDDVIKYAIDFGRYSRPQNDFAPSFIKELLLWGAGPRAPFHLIVGGKARAILSGRHEVLPSDIRSILHPVMRHRIILNYHAESDGIHPDAIISRLLEVVPAPDR